MRLIDADAMRENLLWCKEQSGSYDDYWDDVIERLDAQPTVGGWVSVKDGLPEEKENPYTKDYQEVLCVLSTRFGTDVRVYKFGKGHFWNGPQEIDRMISHWMPFPNLPKEEA